MTPIWFFYIKSTWLTPSSLVIQISEAIYFWKEETRPYPLYTLAYILVMKNIEYNQEKHKLLQISPFKILLKGMSIIQSWRLLMMRDQLAQ